MTEFGAPVALVAPPRDRVLGPLEPKPATGVAPKAGDLSVSKPALAPESVALAILASSPTDPAERMPTCELDKSPLAPTSCWLALAAVNPPPAGCCIIETAFGITLLSLNGVLVCIVLEALNESPDSDSLLLDELDESLSELVSESLESELLALKRFVLSACEFSVSEKVKGSGV